MALRIHFTYDDLARVVLAEEPDPLWEGLLSLHLLQNRDGPLVFGRWRRASRGPFDPELSRLRRLAPPRGYSADFLTPSGAVGGFEAGLDALLATPRARLRTDLTELSLPRSLPGWSRPLADGDTQALRGLGGLVRRHHERFVAPYWTQVRARFDEARSAAARALLRSGFSGLAQGLHPSVRWSAPVLHIAGSHLRGDLHLDGRGLRIIPSFFCWPGRRPGGGGRRPHHERGGGPRRAQPGDRQPPCGRAPGVRAPHQPAARRYRPAHPHRPGLRPPRRRPGLRHSTRFESRGAGREPTLTMGRRDRRVLRDG